MTRYKDFLSTYTPPPDADLEALRALERKSIWLSTYMIHNANNLREKRDGLKVGGHQASSSSMATILTALYWHHMLPQDRTAVKPHASPIFHSIQYLAGRQSLDQLNRFRGFGGVQSYPSRTKDSVDVDFSTGSVGLGAAVTTFAALIQDYLVGKGLQPAAPLSNGPGNSGRLGKMIALVGDAELDEGNVYEALLESAKLGVRNNWWIVDYNRQSLDKVTDDRGAFLIDKVFRANDWRVVTLKYGKKMAAAFNRTDCAGGRHVKKWLNSSDNTLYSALCFQGGANFRAAIERDCGSLEGVREWLAAYSDEELFDVMTDLGGHCMQTVIEGLEYAQREADLHGDDSNFIFIAYTIKGYGLQIQGHPDNHGLFLNQAQVDRLQEAHSIPAGEEWGVWSGMDEHERAAAQRVVESAPFFALDPRGRGPATAGAAAEAGGEVKGVRALDDASDGARPVHVPTVLPIGKVGPGSNSTQTAFGQVMLELGKAKPKKPKKSKKGKKAAAAAAAAVPAEPGPCEALAARILTTAPDVATSTNLSGFLNQRGMFAREGMEAADPAKEHNLMSVNQWVRSPQGQHVELGIAEANLFLMLTAAGMSHTLFGERLLPVGTLYDPFIARGLDQLNYGCYMDARFLVVSTPSGITLGPEGGAHQSLSTPLIGMGQPGLLSYEPAFADEVQLLMAHAFRHMQQPAGEGGSVYLRLSTRPLEQPSREYAGANGSIEGASAEAEAEAERWQQAVVHGGYWHDLAADDADAARVLDVGAGADGAAELSECQLAVVFCGALYPEALAAVRAIRNQQPGVRAALLQVTSPDALHNEWTDASSKADSHVHSLLAPLPANATLVTW